MSNGKILLETLETQRLEKLQIRQNTIDVFNLVKDEIVDIVLTEMVESIYPSKYTNFNAVDLFDLVNKYEFVGDINKQQCLSLIISHLSSIGLYVSESWVLDKGSILCIETPHGVDLQTIINNYYYPPQQKSETSMSNEQFHIMIAWLCCAFVLLSIMIVCIF